MARAAVLIETQTGIDANTNGAAIPAPAGGAAPKVGIFIDVTVATAGTLDIALQYSLDGGTTWAVDEAGADSLAQIAATGQSFKTFDVKAAHYRLVYTVVTGPFTFTVRHYAIG